MYACIGIIWDDSFAKYEQDDKIINPETKEEYDIENAGEDLKYIICYQADNYDLISIDKIKLDGFMKFVSDVSGDTCEVVLFMV